MTMEREKRLQAAVDELGKNRAQQAILETREEELRDFIKENTSPENARALGARFEAVRVDADRNQVAWKKVAMHFNPSRQLLSAHTTKNHVVTIRTAVRKDVLAEEVIS
jgi:predicted NAD-dependent protein-ADP-ribosyltransferase YbiA (DUF1768 family)